MEIKVQSTHFIKPSKPTPDNRRDFKLSALDQLAPPSYTNMILYYKTIGEVDDVSDRCDQLVRSLSEVLSLYYPLAGRITKDGLKVDCSDQGVKYLETRVNVTLDDFLKQGPKIDYVGQLISAFDLVTNALLIVQVNVFDCGSLVIGVSASHKVIDADNLVRFINAWASTNMTGACSDEYYPSFDDMDMIFRPNEFPSIGPFPDTDDQQPTIITKRFVFNRTAISNMRAKALSKNGKKSRVTLVSSLIWKALITVDQVKSGKLRKNLLSPAITLRGKTGLPISGSSFGNIWFPYSIRFSQTGTEPTFADIVALIDDTTRKMINWLSKASGEEICREAKASYSEAFEEIRQNKFTVITSWCRFPIYEADFGWGKPCWTSAAGVSYDMVTLMDDKDGDGIEAWVSLREKDMFLFEQDQDIKAFTS